MGMCQLQRLFHESWGSPVFYFLVWNSIPSCEPPFSVDVVQSWKMMTRPVGKAHSRFEGSLSEVSFGVPFLCKQTCLSLVPAQCSWVYNPFWFPTKPQINGRSGYCRKLKEWLDPVCSGQDFWSWGCGKHQQWALWRCSRIPACMPKDASPACMNCFPVYGTFFQTSVRGVGVPTWIKYCSGPGMPCPT